MYFELKVGDKVRILDDTFEAKVLEIKGDLVVISDEFGFEHSVKKERIIPIFDPEKPQKVNIITPIKEPGITKMPARDETWQAGAPKPKKVRGNFSTQELEILKNKESKPKKSVSSKIDSIEIDLHLEEILDKDSILNDAEKLNFQLEFAKEKLADAMSKKIKTVIFIHGKGEGKLRKSLRDLLDGFPQLEYHDASYQKYGTGATAVRVRYS